MHLALFVPNRYIFTGTENAFLEDQNALGFHIGREIEGAAMTAEDAQQAVIDFLSDPANFELLPCSDLKSVEVAAS
jgi:hypothetical protein